MRLEPSLPSRRGTTPASQRSRHPADQRAETQGRGPWCRNGLTALGVPPVAARPARYEYTVLAWDRDMRIFRELDKLSELDETIDAGEHFPTAAGLSGNGLLHPYSSGLLEEELNLVPDGQEHFLPLLREDGSFLLWIVIHGPLPLRGASKR